MAAGVNLKEKWRSTPHTPGVYLMKGEGGRVIYVGKAKDLHRRLANYFSPSRATLDNSKTRALISAIEDFDYYEVRNEQESLLLEQKLIKEYRPHYNVQLRDDKRYLLLRATRQEPLPRFCLVRLRKDDGARYIGPFVHSTALKETIEWLNHRFHLRSCTARNPGEEEYRHCHDDIIRHCSAPCVGRISQEAYRACFDEALGLLEGHGVREHLDALTQEMQAAAEALEFEQAARLRDVRENILKTLEPARRFTRRAPDLPGTVNPEADLAELAGALGISPPEVMECFDISNLSSSHIVASMVRFTHGRPDNKAYRRYRIRSVDTQNDFASMLEVVRRRYSRILGESRALYDKPAGMSAYAWLKQLGAEGRAPITVPDLVVVDGGKGQLSTALRVLQEIGLGDMPVVGLAKRDEEIYFPHRAEPLVLQRDSGALRLLQRLRDEAHRFANNYNELLMRKRVRESRLDAYPGMTPKRKELLLASFRSLARLRTARPDELAALPGISRAWATRFCEWLAQQP
ncbi:MAG: excinuclease ABC subunit UvrC [Akkermansiaceae bacterium]|nr:excinuclease ABC subunit UvrC [Akkermansiaceae bacterium]